MQAGVPTDASSEGVEAGSKAVAARRSRGSPNNASLFGVRRRKKPIPEVVWVFVAFWV